MATRARIGLLQEDGTILSVYHHWDGYPEWLGKKLNKNYTTKESILNLMKDGDISCLECNHDWNHNKLPEPIILTYKMRGGESPSMIHSNKREYYKSARDCGGNYAYLFADGKWNCYNLGSGRNVKIPVEEVTQ